MSEMKQRVILERRGVIRGNGVWLSREGGMVKISYDFAGRFSKKDQRFYVEDIATLAKFVSDTGDPS